MPPNFPRLPLPAGALQQRRKAMAEKAEELLTRHRQRLQDLESALEESEAGLMLIYLKA